MEQVKNSKLIMTLLVRDEVDIVKYNIDFHLAHGVDFIIATDNGSVDGTREILKEYEDKGFLLLIDEKENNYNQSKWVNRMGKIAYEKYGADIIFHCDADEFWYPKSGNLKNEIFNNKEIDVLSVDVINVLLEDKQGQESFPKDTKWAVTKPIETINYEEDSKLDNFYLFKYPPKVIFKTKKILPEVVRGNHSLKEEFGYLKKEISKDINIFHFPLRNKNYFLKRVKSSGEALINNKWLKKGESFHMKRWYESYKNGKIDEDYKKIVIKNERIAELKSNGIVIDFDFNELINTKNKMWKYNNPKFEYEDNFQDLAWPWAGHKYFAYDLISNLKPEVIVELGTHYGTSLWSFSQAVKDYYLDTEINAVDTWVGEKHAGFYGEEVFKTVNDIKNKYYPNLKINLIRKKFDEALSLFEDNSIDILHVDGLHTYEAVKNDFENWIPKVKEGGIILFHDIMVSRDDFGVYKLWEELKNNYKTLEFGHSYGLGVLIKGKNSLFDKKKELELNYSYLVEDIENKKISEIIFNLKNKEEIISQKEKNIKELELKLEDKNGIINQKELELKNKEEIINQKNIQLNAILNSTIWKITKPMRNISDKIKRLTDLIRYSFVVFKNEGFFSLTKRTVRFFYKKINGKFSVLRGLVKKSFFVLKTEGLLSLTKKVFFYIKKRNIILNNKNSSEGIAIEIFNKQQSEILNNDIKNQINNFIFNPLISVIMPVYNTPAKWLDLAIESVLNQYYNNWELCIVDDYSSKKETREILEKYLSIDKRIKIKFLDKNGGISKTSNVALEMSEGSYVALLDHDDELTPDALFWVVKTLNEKPNTDFIYSDECKIDDSGKRNLFQFFFKPDWSPEMMFNCMYTNHLTVYKKSLVESVGMFRSEYDFSQDYDLALRCSEKAENICHIERILYLWRAIDGSAAKEGGKDFARKTNIAALQEALKRRGLKAKVLELPHANYVHFLDKDFGKVSIVIPSDSYKNIKRSIDNILKKTNYRNYEIIVVCNSDLKKILEKEYKNNNIIFSGYDKKFNFSAKCNQGADIANGEILVFYNDDVIPFKDDWLKNLTEYLNIEGVGGVSPRLLYENGKIQYAGMFTGVPGLVGTAYSGYHKDEIDNFLTMHRYVRDVSILSGACFAVKKIIFNKIGTFDEINTPNGHSDVDLSFKIFKLGLRCLYTPYSTLTHIGNHSWCSKKNEKDKSDIFLLKKWGEFLGKDIYFTDSMKKVLYKDFVYNFTIFSSFKNNIDNKKDIILISHQLSATGAPRMLFNAAIVLKNNGFFPVVVSPIDGPLRHELELNNITTIIDETIYIDNSINERFIKNFDLIIANTIVSFPVVKKINNFDIPILWWIHEAKTVEDIFIPIYKEMGILETLKNQKNNIYVPSEYSKKILEKYSNNVYVLCNGIEDVFIKNTLKNQKNKIIFGLIGTVEERKGQDVFIDAILKLPVSYKSKILIYFMGYENNASAFYVKIKKKSNHIDELIWYGLVVDQKNKNKIFKDIDVFVVPSRDDPAPLVVLEASMLEKVSIISKNTGSNFIFNNSINGFIFDTGNSEQLKNIMMKIIDDPKILESMGKEARKMYLKTSTKEIFEENLLKEINLLLNNK